MCFIMKTQGHAPVNTGPCRGLSISAHRKHPDASTRLPARKLNRAHSCRTCCASSLTVPFSVCAAKGQPSRPQASPGYMTSWEEHPGRRGACGHTVSNPEETAGSVTFFLCCLLSAVRILS